MAQTHPLVGSWRVAVSVPAAKYEGVNLATFGADGTVVVTFPSPSPAAPGQNHTLEYFGPALGTWVAGGERDAAMTFVTLGADESGYPIGSHTISAEVEVAADGRTWRGSFAMEIAAVSGAVQATIPGAVTATRIAVTRLAASAS
jgi:hypothetical protein